MPPTSTNNFFGIKVSKAGIPVNQASDRQLIYKDDFSTKTYYDNTNARMIEGKLPDGSYGLWVSKPGFDVTTATADQLVFNSNQNIFKIVKTDTTSIPAVSFPGTGGIVFQSIIIPHGLSYIPVLQAYAQVGYATFPTGAGSQHFINAYVSLPYNGSLFASSSSDFTYYVDAAVDSTNVYFTYYYFASSTYGAADFPFTPIKYDLLQESAK